MIGLLLLFNVLFVHFAVGATLTGEIKVSSALLVEVDVTSSVAPPTTATWSGPTGAVLVEDGSTVFQISSDIMDPTTISYVNKLVMSPELPGVYRLEVGTEYYTADFADQTIIAPASMTFCCTVATVFKSTSIL